MLKAMIVIQELDRRGKQLSKIEASGGSPRAELRRGYE
jgi:hypothetical protein